MKKTLVVLIALVMCLSLAVSGMAEVAGGVKVEANEASQTGYTVSFAYYDDQATNVKIAGGFNFYETNDPDCFSNGLNLPEGDKIQNHVYVPQEWTKEQALNHVFDVGYVEDMVKDETTGAWIYTVDLPGASYLYQYQVSYDNGETFKSICDPANVPYVNTLGASQARSQFYVPYDADKHSAADDWTFVSTVEDEAARGEILYVTHDTVAESGAPLLIYLPAGYDAEREEAYKVLYLCHGGGGEEGDWIHQGNANDIIDRLIAEGKTEGFIFVCIDTNYAATEKRGILNWDLIYQALKESTIPYIEANYNVVKDASGRAYAALSNGAKIGTELFYREPGMFGWYGLFSGSACWDWPVQDDYSAMKEPKIYIACGWADQLYTGTSYHTDSDKSAQGFAELLDGVGITYNEGRGMIIVQGAHDWYTWQQNLKDFVENYLWK